MTIDSRLMKKKKAIENTTATTKIEGQLTEQLSSKMHGETLGFIHRHKSQTA